MTSPGISVVVPVYRGAATLEALTRRLGQVLPQLADAYELILVNDGSPDKSWQVIEQLSREFPWVVGVRLMRNYGQHNATLCGVRLARHDVVVTMDDDLQNPPEEIPKLIARLTDDADVVYGVAAHRQREWWRSLFARLVKNAIAFVMGLRNVRDIGAFKAFRTELRQAFADYRGPDVLLDVLLSWGTSRFAAVEVEEAPRAAGRSNYSFWKLVRVSLLVLTSYTTLPLRLASLLGLLFTLFGLGVLVYVLYVYFVLGSIPGFSFLASAITIFSGVQLFSLGVIGEYLARMFDRTGGRPPYAVAAVIRGGKAE